MAVESTTPKTGGIDLPAEVVRDVLADSHRRTLLTTLADGNATMPVEDLAAVVAAAEADVPVEDVDETRRERVWTTLYDEHLPKLTATGIVSYDSLRETVTLEKPEVLEQRD